jgi:hypothetical protein
VCTMTGLISFHTILDASWFITGTVIKYKTLSHNVPEEDCCRRQCQQG